LTLIYTDFEDSDEEFFGLMILFVGMWWYNLVAGIRR